MSEWKPIESAPKDGSYILAIYQSPGDRNSGWTGRPFVIRHEGRGRSGYDLGWGLFPGYGGVPDDCFSAWQPLPSPPETPHA